MPDQTQEELEAKTRQADPVIKILRKIHARRIALLKEEELPKQLAEFEHKEPEDFLNVMGTVIQSEVKSIIKRMGKGYLFWHRKEIRSVVGEEQ